jgi:hypothetical protein
LPDRLRGGDVTDTQPNTWFAGPARPVNGGGNTCNVKPAGEEPPVYERSIVAFREPERPIGGGGNEVWVKPNDAEPRYWGSNPSPELDRLIALFHRALFREDETYGPEFRFTSSPRRLFTADDLLLATAADQMAFAVLDHADEIAVLLAAIREQAAT